MKSDATHTRRYFKLIVPLLAVSLVLLLAEAAVRLVGTDLNAQPHLRYDAKYGWLLEPSFTDIDEFNPDGFRGPTTGHAKRDGVRRLLVLGDSFSFAGAQPFSVTYPGLLAEWLLGDEETAWEVASLSIPDWGTAQELIALDHLGLPFEPDVIVLQTFPYNDLCNNTLEIANTCGALQDHHRPYFVLDETDALTLRFLRPWASRARRVSRLFGLAEEAWIGLGRRSHTKREIARANFGAAGLPEDWVTATAMIPQDLQPEPLRKGWAVTQRLLEEIRTRGDDAGALVLGVTIPYFSTFDRNWVAEQEAAGVPLDAQHDTEGMATRLAAAGIPHLPMRRLIGEADLPPASFFIPDNGHLSDLGHAFLARWILEELADRGQTSARPPELDFVVAADFMASEQPSGFSTVGLTPIRTQDGTSWRFGLGPSTTFEFTDTRIRTVALSFSVVGLFPEQEFGVEVNGQTRHHVTGIPVQRSALTQTATFTTQPGVNTVVLQYKDWNRRSQAYLPGESRVLAAKFVRLSIQEMGHGAPAHEVQVAGTPTSNEAGPLDVD